MALQTVRVTFLTSPEFKAFLTREAKNMGISVSELIRLRCQTAPTADEAMLAEMANQLAKAVKKANVSIDRGIRETSAIIKELQKKRAKK